MVDLLSRDAIHGSAPATSAFVVHNAIQIIENPTDLTTSTSYSIINKTDLFDNNDHKCVDKYRVVS